MWKPTNSCRDRSIFCVFFLSFLSYLLLEDKFIIFLFSLWLLEFIFWLCRFCWKGRFYCFCLMIGFNRNHNPVNDIFVFFLSVICAQRKFCFGFISCICGVIMQLEIQLLLWPSLFGISHVFVE